MSALRAGWLRLSIPLPPTPVATAECIEALLGLGASGVQEEPQGLVAWFGGPGAGEAPDPVRLEADLRAASTAVGPGDVRVAWIAHEDWSASWKRGLASRRVGRRFVVSPTWCEPKIGREDLRIDLDPGAAFGTAEHGTTRGCLRLMEDAVSPGHRILDVGAGSGILSIAAVRLGADSVLSVEMDPVAARTAASNARLNHVADRVEVLALEMDAAGLHRLGPWDGIVANLQATLLAPLLAALPGALVPGGWVILSGVLTDEWSAFEERAGAAGLKRTHIDRDGPWTSGRFGASPTVRPG